jgi:hypothetical protein
LFLFQQRKIESYREEQKNGKDLNSDQLAAVAKYEEVLQTLEFARDLCKQFNGIAVDAVKQHKKQARKEALEKAQQEVAKIKEILMVQVRLWVAYLLALVFNVADLHIADEARVPLRCHFFFTLLVHFWSV